MTTGDKFVIRLVANKPIYLAGVPMVGIIFPTTTVYAQFDHNESILAPNSDAYEVLGFSYIVGTPGSGEQGPMWVATNVTMAYGILQASDCNMTDYNFPPVANCAAWTVN